MKNNIVQFEPYRQKKFLDLRVEAYAKVIHKMEKLELLEEMERFVDSNAKRGPSFLNKENVLRGIILYKELNKQAETDELSILSRNYITYLNECLNKLEGKGNISNDAS